MVSVVHSVAALSDFEQFLATLTEGLTPVDAERLKRAVEFAWETYGDKNLGSGERIWSHALGMAVIIAGLKLDAAVARRARRGLPAPAARYAKRLLSAAASPAPCSRWR